jgi:hypothetical protein
VNIFNVYRGQDTGGWGHRLGEAFRDDPDITFRSMYAPNAFLYIDYPTDLEWDRKTGAQLWREADVVHLHNGFRAARIFEQRGPERPALVHYHGTQYRRNPATPLQEQRRRGAIGVVSTLDLWLIAPDDTEWLPSPYSLEFLSSLRP